MIAASACDIDGLSILLGQEAFWRYHHTVGHNLFFAVAAAVVIAALLGNSRRDSRRGGFGATFALCLAMFHLHLLLDFLGSGPGWPIHYLWPFHAATWINPWAWPFYSWENLGFFFALLVWTIWIARRWHRTPLEAIYPKLDRDLISKLFGRSADSTFTES